ncbi:periplasmic secreted protein [Liquorilactobacillus ghanensis DSM 18630]|uniref:Periplasmic secreted protein n=2 Tax=Liquorilactobacillus ghanensis TaxID=399370 RepID=A0A0R1VK57_9LACO|nr:periplasmic secreted protein [Liquorilactobacillus ghanensis DSM 18630]
MGKGVESMFELSKPKASLGAIIWKSIWYGFIAGMISGMVKIGWENILPPRTLARNLTNPPQHLLEQIGFSAKTVHAFVYYSTDQKVFYVALLMHFGFSIVFAALFLFLAQYWKITTLWQGAAYGIVIWIAFHLIILPALGTIPAPWHQPFSEHFSEFFGHIVWSWSIYAVAVCLAKNDKKHILRNL